MGDLVDTACQPTGSGSDFRAMTCQIQLSIISVEMRLDTMSVGNTSDVGHDRMNRSGPEVRCVDMSSWRTVDFADGLMRIDWTGLS